ncbi:MAG: DNA recombination protein RmuC, partial [Rhizobiales bacterium]|nr:DNA recombination protein RmuC [Hyphomicrobiales bacterium]
RQILISTEKIEKRGARIQEVEFGNDGASVDVIPAPMTRKLGAGE